jgi:prolipoprotein diacylglyceryltransferase
MPPLPPWSLLLAVAAASAYALTRYSPSYKDQSTLAFFLAIYGVLTFARLVYSVVLWPKLFSPLRHLPRAPVRGSRAHPNQKRD